MKSIEKNIRKTLIGLLAIFMFGTTATAQKNNFVNEQQEIKSKKDLARHDFLYAGGWHLPFGTHGFRTGGRV